MASSYEASIRVKAPGPSESPLGRREAQFWHNLRSRSRPAPASPRANPLQNQARRISPVRFSAQASRDFESSGDLEN